MNALRRSTGLQILVIASLWLVGEGLSRAAHLPIPGGVIGLILLLALLASGRLELSSVQKGARWLIAEMLLFFIPAVLAVLDHAELIGWLGIKILLVILLGTVAVMCATALAVEWLIRAPRARERQ
jgi:holin-like protein